MAGKAADRRWRFDGVLAPRELETAQEQGVAVGYCPVQLGWVPLSAQDEEVDAPLSWHAGQSAGLTKQMPGTPVYPVTRSFGFRPWVEDDLPRYRAMLADADLWRFMPEPVPLPLADADLRALIDLSAAGDHHLVRAIVHAGRPIGQVRLEFAPDRTGAEISYWLGRDARGQGLGRRAVAEFLDHTLPRLPALRRLTARVHPDNAASARLLLSCGFGPVDRAASGLAPRGRDTGGWPVFLRTLPQGTSSDASP